MSIELAGLLASFFTIIAAIYRVPAGFVSDRIHFMDGGVLLGTISFLEIMGGSAVMVFSETFLWNVVGMLIIALGTGGGNAATYKILPKFSKASITGKRW